MRTFVADFETTTNPDNCFVWAYAICEVGNTDNIIVGTTIEDFMKWCETQEDNVKVLFHNLKFDLQFILNYLFKEGYNHTTDPRDKASRTFNTLISDKGLYYQAEVIFNLKGKKVNKVVFQDSLKLINMSVDAIAKTFHMPMQKLEIDYKAHDDLPKGSPLSPEEEEYIKHDVIIVATAIEYFYSQGLTKMTIGSCALDDYKKIVQKRKFEKYYPTPKYHKDVKQSYRGGFTYLYPKFAGKTVKEGIVLDVNSLYPSVMYYDYLPFGTPIHFKGKYKEDKVYPLYTQMFSCEFKLKKGKIPTIQVKFGSRFKSNEYLTQSDGAEVELCLNNVDLELFFEQYEVWNIEWLSGWKFKATQGLFTDYIDKWSANKIKAKEEGNHGLYLISKLFLNSLYGKFGTDTKVKSKIPYMGEDGVVHFYDSEEEERDGVYVAMASFITSYARLKTITAFQKVLDDHNSGKTKAEPVYADTDSLHIVLNGEDADKFLANCGLDIDPTKLGAWDYETKFNKGKFLRQKCYIENSTKDVKNPNPEYKLKITVAGMPPACYEYVNFNNFKIGANYKGKKQPKIVRGGVVLAEVDFTIKES